MADLSKYKEVKTVTADIQSSGLEQVNTLLAEGWELIDAKIVQWTLRADHPPGYGQSAQWHFTLGRTQAKTVKPAAGTARPRP